MWWYGDHFGGLGQFHGPGVVGFVLMIILWAAVIAAIVIGVRALILAGRRRSSGSLPPSSGLAPSRPEATMPARESERSEALRILDERYARGEIDRENYLRTKADLTGQIDGSGTGQGVVA